MRETRCMTCSSTLTAASVVLSPQAPHMPVLTLPLLSSLYCRKLEKHRDTRLSLQPSAKAGPGMQDPHARLLTAA